MKPEPESAAPVESMRGEVEQNEASHFRTTQWGLVLQAGRDDTQGAIALEELCRAYWYPLYAFVRRQGNDQHTAQDLTQEFFARLLQGNRVAIADPSRGRFRSFLLASLKNFLANEWQKAARQKRGGDCVIFSMNQCEEEDRERFEPASHLSPDKLFDRHWAETLVARANARLRREYEAAGWVERFDALKVYLLNDSDPPSYAETAARLGLTESALRSAIYKMRQRYGQMFRAEVEQTIGGAAELESEIQCLLEALSDG